MPYIYPRNIPSYIYHSEIENLYIFLPLSLSLRVYLSDTYYGFVTWNSTGTLVASGIFIRGAKDYKGSVSFRTYFRYILKTLFCLTVSLFPLLYFMPLRLDFPYCTTKVITYAKKPQFHVGKGCANRHIFVSFTSELFLLLKLFSMEKQILL